MQGDFTSADLRNVAIIDGRGPEIPKDSFRSLVWGMVKDGLIAIVAKEHGGYPGIYRRADQKPNEPSQPSLLNPITQKGGINNA